MLITRYGHAALLIESRSTRVLIDPGAFSTPETFGLTSLDAIIATHQHPDHLDPERGPGLIVANPTATLLCDPQTASTVQFGTWTENRDGSVTAIGDLTITGVGAQHAEILPEIERIANVGVLVRDNATTLYHPGDTYAYTPEAVDVLALPLSAPWTKISETVAFAQKVRPTTVLPIHDATISDLGYPLYWNQVATHSGTDDARRLRAGDSLSTD